MSMSIEELAALAEQTEDQTETTTMEFEYEPPVAGVTIGRFIEYIELGKQPQKPYQGKAKPPAEEVRLTFELLHPERNIKEFEENGQKIKRGQLITFRLAKKLGEKAKFKKLFNKMTYGRPIKHMARMLGEAFIITIYHNEVEKDGKKVTYANIWDKAGDIGIQAPVIPDPIAGTTAPVNVPQPLHPIRIFLWDNPTKDTWDTLFIDGTREVKKQDGTVEQVSKNWLQEVIMSATNYSGSALHQMQSGVDDLPGMQANPQQSVSTANAGAASLPGSTGSAGTAAPTENGKPMNNGSVTPSGQVGSGAGGNVSPAQSAAPTAAASAEALAALGLVA